MHNNTTPVTVTAQPRTTTANPAVACFHRDVTRLYDRRAHIYAAQTPYSLTNYIIAVESTSSPGSTDLITTDHKGVERGNVIASVPTSDFDTAIRTLGYTVHPVVLVAKATLCFQGSHGMSWNVVHVRDLEIVIGPYAQYVAALHVSYTPKGARNRKGFVSTHNPTLVVLEGWVDVAMPSMWDATTSSGNVTTTVVTTSRSRGSSFDDVWNNDFATALTSALSKGARIVADYRGYDSHSGT